jgi:hypothetical protein
MVPYPATTSFPLPPAIVPNGASLTSTPPLPTWLLLPPPITAYESVTEWGPSLKTSGSALSDAPPPAMTMPFTPAVKE